MEQLITDNHVFESYALIVIGCVSVYDSSLLLLTTDEQLDLFCPVRYIGERAADPCRLIMEPGWVFSLL